MRTTSVVIRTPLRVEYSDGKVCEYTPKPIDNHRANKVVPLVVDGDINVLSFPALAWAVATRVGDSYRQRRQTTNPLELYEAWLEGVDDVLRVQNDDDDQDDDDDPKDSSSTEADSPDE